MTFPRSARTPVLTVATQQDIVDRSVASYNVRETLIQRFDLEEMVEKVRRALREPVVAPAPPGSGCPDDEVFCHAHRILTTTVPFYMQAKGTAG